MRVSSQWPGEGIAFQAWGLPCPKGSHKLAMKPFPRVVPVNNAALQRWEKAVRASAMAALGADPLLPRFEKRPLHVDITFVLRAPKKVRRWAHFSREDLDKLVRSTLDPLSKLVYDDDRRVVELSVRKLYDGAVYGMKGTGAVIDVWPLDAPPLPKEK